MKTLILYATKYGATAEIAQKIAAKTDDATTQDLKNTPAPNLDEYECIIIGTSIYAGNIRKEAKEFLAQNIETLKTKKLGLYISGMEANKDKESLNACFPNELVNTAKAISSLGGAFDPKKAGFFERLIMKVITKQSGYISTISEEKIDQFVEQMKA